MTINKIHRPMRKLLAVLLEVVLNGDPVLDDDQLGLLAAFQRAHQHRPVDRFTTGEEFSLGDDGATATGLAAFLAALPFGLQARGALQRSHFIVVGACVYVSDDGDGDANRCRRHHRDRHRRSRWTSP